MSDSTEKTSIEKSIKDREKQNEALREELVRLSNLRAKAEHDQSSDAKLMGLDIEAQNLSDQVARELGNLSALGISTDKPVEKPVETSVEKPVETEAPAFVVAANVAKEG